MLNPTFSRRVLLMLAIEELERPSVPSLMKRLDWPRRTVQDVIKALAGMGVEVSFIEDGVRHNDGYYQLASWGSINRDWAKAHQSALQQSLLS
ncbi:helix-turn-helix domain-containing protein [uncultured Ferrimonas sp.]|uniref:helix-turn-helix domain-containing protein n=1 Tax=uncultured Ferrimonas sp. TaxID=432640 RepID=UPI002626B1F8|nr:helix-turn-helix domain-containing protein [uncultured Ferrimonas sp.]